MLNKTTLLLAAVVALSGCQATQRQNATTGETETNATTKGALLGALAGAAVGLATGDDAKERRKHALIGAAGALQSAAVSGTTLISKKQSYAKHYWILVFKWYA